MTVLFVGLAVLVGVTQLKAVRTLKAGTRVIKRWGGWILVAVGTWLIVLAAWTDFFTGVFDV